MSRFRLILLGLLAVVAVGAVSAGPASADSCNGGAHVVFCTSPGNLPLVGETVLGSGGLALLASIIGGAEAKFHCPSFDVTGTLGELGVGKGLLLFLNCKEELPGGCKLSAANEKEIDANFNTQQQTTGLALDTGSGTGEEFTSLAVESKPGESCAANGTLKVTGKQMVETTTGAAVNQTVTAKKAESFLKLGAEKASFNGVAQVHLGGANLGSAWLVMSGE
ncbi:MAG TPA: hypothetical protein VGH60_10260 [Solirubrobacteraceae bacterium]